MSRLSKRWVQHNQIGLYAVAVLAAVVTASTAPTAATALESLVSPVLAVLLYVTFLEVPFVRLREAVRDRRFMGAALGVNFLIVPVVAFGLTRALPSNSPVLVGALFVLLTPCVDYVITFTELAEGDGERITAATPALLLVQLLLLPLYLRLFVGPEVAGFVEAGPFLEAFALLIVLPLSLAWATEIWAERSDSGRVWAGAMGWLPVPAMGATLFVVIASQLPRVRASLDAVAAVVPVYVVFLVVMALIGRVVARVAGMEAGESRAIVFTSVTRNSLVILPLVLALPPGYELAPAVVVTQTLVELAGMVVLTRVVPAVLVPDTWGETASGG